MFTHSVLQFRVPWENRSSPNRPQKEVAVRVALVKRIDVRSVVICDTFRITIHWVQLYCSTLHRLTQGDPDSIRPESDSSTAINMLNLFIQSTPRM